MWPATVDWLGFVVAAIVLGFAIRKLRLCWLARSPRVQVTAFAWTGPSESDRDATWVTSLFREQLTALQLDPLDALPERAPGASLVDIVEGVSQTVSQKVDVGKALGRAWRAIWPDSAYEVWGTLRPLQGNGRISVQLVDRAGGNRILLSEALDDADWTLATREAAMAVAGALYPQVSRRYRGPWTAWSEAVPRELIGKYHRAHELEDENRLEEAMDAYHDTLRHDPLNPDLRLRIAMLQERLALDLDAWVTYRAIVDETDRRAWSGPDRRTRFLALYRLAILLGNRRLAEQWVKDRVPTRPLDTERDRERWDLRYELMITLERDGMLVGDTPSFGFVSRRRPVAPSAAGLLHELRGPAPRSPQERRWWVRRLFLTLDIADEQNAEFLHLEQVVAALQLMSLRRFEEIDAWLRLRPPLQAWREWRLHRPPPRMWLRRRDFSRRAIKVSKRLVRLRIAASTERRLRREGKSVLPVRTEHRLLTRRWPFPAERPLQQLARVVAPRQRWADRREDSWQLHYNAACALAAPLIDGSVLWNTRRELGAVPELEGKSRQRPTREWRRKWPLSARTTQADIVKRAVAELEEYAHRAGTDRVARQASWVGFDDPDLVGLAETEEFKLWASHHLPLRLPEVRPDRNIDVDRYTVRLVHHSARAFALAWLRRAEESDAPAKAVVAWWRGEKDAWARLAEVCWEYRSWQHRLDGLMALERWQTAAAHSPRIDFGHEQREQTIACRPIENDLLDWVAGLAADGGGRNGLPPTTVLDWAARRAEQVHAAHQAGAQRIGDRGLAVDAERGEALRAARIWTRLGDLLGQELNGRHNGGVDRATLEDAIREELRARSAAPRGRIASVREAVADWVSP
jgi:hypothetical protein